MALEGSPVIYGRYLMGQAEALSMLSHENVLTLAGICLEGNRE